MRGERPTRSAGPLNAWEPVIYWGGRRAASRFTMAGERIDRASVAPSSSDASSAPGRRVAQHRGEASRSAGATRRVAADVHRAVETREALEHDPVTTHRMLRRLDRAHASRGAGGRLAS